MYDDTVRETIKRRWTSSRPFEGMTTEVIARKLKAKILTTKAADQAERELARRGHVLKPA